MSTLHLFQKQRRESLVREKIVTLPRTRVCNTKWNKGCTLNDITAITKNGDNNNKLEKNKSSQAVLVVKILHLIK